MGNIHKIRRSVLAFEGVRGVTVIVIGNRFGFTSLNPERGYLHFTWIQQVSLQLLVNSRADWALTFWYGNQSKRKKTLNSNQLLTWRGMISTRLFLPKSGYMSSPPTTKPDYQTSQTRWYYHLFGFSENILREKKLKDCKRHVK